MAHDLYLAMYSFGIKKKNTANHQCVENNLYLSTAYPNEENKFTTGFVKDLIDLIDEKVFKNKQDTHGGILAEKSIKSESRILDLLIDGGITGIQQFIINEDGKKTELSKKKVVGLKFFARIWLPANTVTGYLFLQKYGSMSIKPLFDSIIKKIIEDKDFTLTNNRLVPTTTKERMKNFLKYSTIRDIVIVSKKSSHETGEIDAATVSIKLKKITFSNKKTIDKNIIGKALKNHGFTLGDRHYDIRATYKQEVDGYKEEKTFALDGTDETINFVPNIIIPKFAIDENNYPIFSQMQNFVDEEIKQIKKEAKL